MARLANLEEEQVILLPLKKDIGFVPYLVLITTIAANVHIAFAVSQAVFQPLFFSYVNYIILTPV